MVNLTSLTKAIYYFRYRHLTMYTIPEYSKSKKKKENLPEYIFISHNRLLRTKSNVQYIMDFWPQSLNRIS